jgi:anti-sigma regulatory factor (Ser/Thr protein kinase)
MRRLPRARALSVLSFLKKIAAMLGPIVFAVALNFPGRSGLLLVGAAVIILAVIAVAGVKMSEAKNAIRIDQEITLDAELESLDAAQEWVSETLDPLELPGKTLTQISIAVEEIFVNIAQYAYKDRGGKGSAVIRIHFAEDRQLRLVFEDEGVAFNPLEIPAPDTEAPLDERKIGGLGIFLTRQWMDTASYERRDGKNVLTLVRKV